jgi:hypothetical protein
MSYSVTVDDQQGTFNGSFNFKAYISFSQIADKAIKSQLRL